MFILVFRELIIITAGLIIIWFLWRQIRVIGRKDARKEHLQECLDNVNEIIELSKEMPNIDPKRLEAARDKLAKLQKEGSKNG